jgi:hypothetical protein
MNKKNIRIRKKSGSVIINGENNNIYIQAESRGREHGPPKPRAFRLLKWLKGLFVILTSLFTLSCG